MGENGVLRKQIVTLETQEDELSPEKRQDMLRHEIDYGVNQIREQFKIRETEDQVTIQRLETDKKEMERVHGQYANEQSQQMRNLQSHLDKERDNQQKLNRDLDIEIAKVRSLEEQLREAQSQLSSKKAESPVSAPSPAPQNYHQPPLHNLYQPPPV